MPVISSNLSDSSNRRDVDSTSEQITRVSFRKTLYLTNQGELGGFRKALRTDKRLVSKSQAWKNDARAIRLVNNAVRGARSSIRQPPNKSVKRREPEKPERSSRARIFRPH